MITLNQIRTSFLDYFKTNNHTVVKSSPLIPHNDPTLMFTNAGMVQFKNVFTGMENRSYVKAATSQKCVRAGGKHNDLENVGYTARHHTFFEMLGNFSFGDYFKEDAIFYAWDYLTKVVELPKDKLYITVYHTDDEATKLWKKIAGLSDDRIIKIKTNDNFWSMGDTGPCGPCSEIFFDHGDKIAGGLPGSPNEDGDRYIEIWNLVFMQYEQMMDGSRVELPKPSIDTGMGLERIAAVLQHVHDNYDVDLFKYLIDASVRFSGARNEGNNKFSHRVIADHLRSTCFLIADGVMPSNEGRGYVLRRIMRRAMRHAHQLGAKEPLMHKLVHSLVEQMGDAYPELVKAEELIVDVLRLEEERFRETLGRGIKLLDTESHELKAGDTLSGEVAFKLYDTYGFPLDLTKDILRSKEISVDEKDFETHMAEQKRMARESSKGSGDKAIDSVWFNIHEETGDTEFLGYDHIKAQAKVLALVQDNKIVDKVSGNSEFCFVTNQTPFYGESGGQIGDVGTVTNGAGMKAEVFDTVKFFGKLIVHKAKLTKGELKKGDTVDLSVDGENRTSVKANHSATHLLHAVLRKHLGSQVVQKGSAVYPDKLRFDFSYMKSVTKEEITAIENEVNRLIRENTKTKTHLMDLEKAMACGAMALFGEKYDEEVRVVSMGGIEDAYSTELCGGTHVTNTGDIGFFKITNEYSVAAGIRRIEAITGKEAVLYAQRQETLIREIAEILKSKPEEALEKITNLQKEKKVIEKQLSEAKKASFSGSANLEVEEISGVKFAQKLMQDVPAKDLRGFAESMLKSMGSGIAAIISVADGKASVIIAVSPEHSTNFSAVDLVKIAANELGGSGGGGKPEMAQAGGSKTDNSEAVFNLLKKKIAGQLHS